MDGRKIGGILITLALIGLAIFLRLRQRGEHSSEIRTVAMATIISMPEYQQNKKLLNEMADIAHDAAFGEAYSMGGRRRQAELDAEKYMEVFFRSMAQQSQARGREDLRKAILALHQGINEAGDDAESSGPAHASMAGGTAAQGETHSRVDDDVALVGDDEDKSLTIEAIAASPDNQVVELIIADIRRELGDKKGAEGVKAIRALSKGRRMIYMTNWVDSVVREDGFTELFGAEFGALAIEGVRSFELIKAKKRAALIRRAIAAFMRENPEQTIIKQSKTIKKYLAEFDDAELVAVDRDYEALKESLGKLRIKYIRANVADMVQSAAGNQE